MAWRVEVIPTPAPQLRMLDRQIARLIGDYIREIVSIGSDPRQSSQDVTANLADLWCYRVGDYRVICQIESEQ